MGEQEAAVETTSAPVENIRDNLDIEAPAGDYTPLFDSEAVSESDLMEETGDAAAEEKPADAEPKGEPEKPEDTENEKPAAEEKNEASDDKGEKKPDEKPAAPPEGYVPYQALAEERGKRQSMSREIDSLRAENDRLRLEASEKKAPALDADADEFKDFKILTDQEYRELIDEDPDEALLYNQRLIRYSDHQRQQAERKQTEARVERQKQQAVQWAIDRMEELAPGVMSDETVNRRLTEFAVSQGVSVNTLQAITDPRTQVILPDGTKTIIGGAAAEIVGMINSFSRAAGVTRESIATEIEKELTPKIEARLKREIMEKLKTDPSGVAFRSLDMAAGSSEKDTKPSGRFLSEAEFARLSPADQEKYLMGEM